MRAVFAKCIIKKIVIWLLDRLNLCIKKLLGEHFRIFVPAPCSRFTPVKTSSVALAEFSFIIISYFKIFASDCIYLVICSTSCVDVSTFSPITVFHLKTIVVRFQLTWLDKLILHMTTATAYNYNIGYFRFATFVYYQDRWRNTTVNNRRQR